MRLPGCGWPIEGDFAVLLNGDPVRIRSTLVWPLPPLPSGPGPDVVVTDRLGLEPIVIRPPSLVVGVGAVRNAPPARILALIDATLAEAGLAAGSVCALATAEIKADDTVATAARQRHWPLLVYPASVLAEIDVPNPSAYVAATIGTPSVAEAAALIGRHAELIVPKRHDGAVTVAVARHPPRGRLTLLDHDGRPTGELRRSSIVVCDGPRAFSAAHPATQVIDGGMSDAVGLAVELARRGNAVALCTAGRHVGAYPAAEVQAALSTVDGSVDREVDVIDSRPVTR